MARAWPALDIHVPRCDPDLVDLVLAELDDYQPTAIEDAGDDQRLRAFFASTEARDHAARALSVSFGHHLCLELAEVDDEDWAARSQAALGPVTVGRITVAPPWSAPTDNEDPSHLSIVIQPSMGFGTGHHATTRLMLGALQRINLLHCETLDLGCGSGVLAIAAVLLGARSAQAVDNDADALLSAAENVGLNRVADRVRLVNADFRRLTSPAGLVLANLNGALLERYAETLGLLVAPGGHLIVSGIMESESAVFPALARHLHLEQVDGEDEWRCGTFSSPQH